VPREVLPRPAPARGRRDPDFVRSLLAGIITHRDLDDVAWQLLSTMATLVQFPALKTRLVHGGARTALLQYPKQRAHEMPRWLEGVFTTFHERVSARE